MMNQVIKQVVHLTHQSIALLNTLGKDNDPMQQVPRFDISTCFVLDMVRRRDKPRHGFRLADNLSTLGT